MNRFLKTVLNGCVAAGALVLAKGVVIGVLAATNPTPQEVVAAQLAREPVRGIYRAMWVHFPAEAGAIRQAMVEALASRLPRDQSLAHLAEETRRIRAPLAQSLAAAPDAEIAGLLREQIALVAVFADDPPACARYVARGMSAVGAGDPRLTGDAVVATAEHLWEAIATYHHAPAPIDPATDADYAALGSALDAAGVAPDAGAIIAANDPDDARLCGAFLDFMRVVTEAEYPGAARVRREAMIALAAG